MNSAYEEKLKITKSGHDHETSASDLEFGLIASAFQVADAGLKLASTIYDSVEKVRSADERLDEFALQIKVTSGILKELAELLKNNLTARLLTTDAMLAVSLTTKGCSHSFKRIQAIVDEARQPGGKWSFPFKSSNMYVLMAGVERHKSNLQLLLSVSLYARMAVHL